MKTRIAIMAVSWAIALGGVAYLVAGQVVLAMDHTPMVVMTAQELKWGPAPPSLPPGAQAAVLAGDPATPELFTMRLKVPDNYRIPPHFHAADEHVTVINGTLVLGMGEKFDAWTGKNLTAGSFAMIPKEMRHFAYAKGETVVEIHGVGPWNIIYVNSSDDPRMRNDAVD